MKMTRLFLVRFVSVLLVALSFGLAPAYAVPLDLKWTPDKLGALCKSLGFTYADTATGGSCTNPDCAGVGKPCTVSCTTESVCDAESPGIVIATMGPIQVLKNLYSPILDDPNINKPHKQNNGSGDSDGPSDPGGCPGGGPCPG